MTQVPRVVKIFQKIRRNDVLKNAEKGIFESACAPGRSLREAAKIFRCSHETIRKIRSYAERNKTVDTDGTKQATQKATR